MDVVAFFLTVALTFLSIVAFLSRCQELALVNQKDELLDAQTQLRRQMGALLEDAAKVLGQLFQLLVCKGEISTNYNQKL